MRSGKVEPCQCQLNSLPGSDRNKKSGHETLLFKIREAVALVTLNRPDGLNSLPNQMGRELKLAFAAVNVPSR
jgi:hypothetical protein